MVEASLVDLLRERASLQPDDTAFTFVDYERDLDGVPESLTWARLYRRVLSLAGELRSHAAPGDRVVIAAPQGLEYVVGFLACLQAGLIAVPLSTPMSDTHDDRLTAVLRDATPTALLTTSAIADRLAGYAVGQAGTSAPVVVEVDTLDLDTRRPVRTRRGETPETAYLQYTSGSTRVPAGVMVSNANLTANFRQMMCDFFPEYGKIAPPGTTVVSWLPFYHDMGLILGICGPILGGWHSVVMSPIAFLQRPARWMQLMASHPRAMTAAPNFAFDLAAARTSDEDLAGRDLGDVLVIYSGAERVHAKTIRRFAQRFAKFNLREAVIRPAYGLAEATLYVSTGPSGVAPKVVAFDPAELSAGSARPAAAGDGTLLVGYGTPESPAVRIVDPETGAECPAGTVGEIWTSGDNVSAGYWRRPEESERTFGATLADPADATPPQRWLRTGDMGFLLDGELFIVGRLKDLLIIRGRNHYPDDIEATVGTISKGRVAAVSVLDGETETLVLVVEARQRPDAGPFAEQLDAMAAQITAAVSTAHELSPADIVMVAPGSLPITTSGKIRRASCAELYRAGRFDRLDTQLVAAGRG